MRGRPQADRASSFYPLLAPRPSSFPPPRHSYLAPRTPSLAPFTYTMAIDFTPIARKILIKRAERTDHWAKAAADVQLKQLRRYLHFASHTEFGKRYGFHAMTQSADPLEEFRRRVPMVSYEDIRPLVMRMVRGESDVLWPGRCRNFAQSSGTSGGKSKYIPITEESLQLNHFPGATDAVAHYLRLVPNSHMFAGKGFILGGSFANELNLSGIDAKVGDLSATLIDRTPAVAQMFRIPEKRIALMADWEKKLPELAAAAIRSNVTNISGVPSWFLGVLKKILEKTGKTTIHEVWPNLEVFFHGGISFTPYRAEYQRIIEPGKMHYIETYNASEGFFASQNSFLDAAMLLILDGGIFYEFLPVLDPESKPLTISEVQPGKIYELVITSVNGLCRYRLGDTVKIESVYPVKITIAGRTRSFINAFGEELMENNAEQAIAEACHKTGATIRNYTAAPVYAKGKQRGRHEWLIEFTRMPQSVSKFAEILDAELRAVNSDYDAKRNHTIFLDPLTVVTARAGLFDDWLREAGTHKLGGQRKVPRLSNSRDIIDDMLRLN